MKDDTSPHSIAHALRVLHPKRYASCDNPNDSMNTKHQRFSTLLLEHGEQELQDWGVVVRSTTSTSTSASTRPSSANINRSGGRNANANANDASMSVSSGSINTSFTKSSLEPSASSSSSFTSRYGHGHGGSSSKRPKNRKDREPSAHMKSVPGRLRLCSKSLIFEPNDISRGIIRIAFDKMMDKPKNEASQATIDAIADAKAKATVNGNMNVNGSGCGYGGEEDSNSCRIIAFQCKRFAVMKKNNVIAPYEVIDRKVRFSMTFQHSSTKSFLELLDKVYASTNHNSSSSTNIDSGSNVNTNTNNNSEDPNQNCLQDIIKTMCDQPFDPSNFVHMHEVPLTNNLRAYILGPFPLAKRAGCAVVTEDRIYFQPFNGVHVHSSMINVSIMANKALSWMMKDIVATARRYHGLKDEALEVFFKEGPSVLLAFEGFQNREDVMRLLPVVRRTRTLKGQRECEQEVPIYCHTDRSFLSVVLKAWSRGEIDNFDYLLALNSAAGRSMFDLSRYPVLPWVLVDYKSSKLDLACDGQVFPHQTFRDLTKPIGALNKERLECFKARWKNMQDMGTAFLYGTHYSAPGYCLYYLVRTMPEQMLCLQNGKYDAPERLFQSIEKSFASLLENQADIKESIPQFYDTKGGVDFLLNTRGLQLGITQNGHIIDDVELPKWAKSPKDFVKKNRQALESDYCTKYLPSWIDLIFGVKARGEQALEANNLFHPTSYVSPIEYQRMAGAEKFQAELQATEFGICPDVLFNSPHPQKDSSQESNDTLLAPDLFRNVVQREIGASKANNLETGRTQSGSPTPKQTSITDRNRQPMSPMKSIMKYAQQISETATLSRDGSIVENGTTDTNEDSGQDIIELDPSDYDVEKTVSSDSKISNLCLSGTGESFRGDGIDGTRTFGSDETQTQSKKPLIPRQIKPDRQSNSTPIDGWTFKPVTIKQMHGGAVSGCHLSLGTSPRVITTSLDGGLMVHLLPTPKSKESRRRSFSSASSFGRSTLEPKVSAPQQFQSFRSHQSSDPLTCLALASDKNEGSVAFAGGHDDVIFAYGINSACGLASVYSHRDAVTGLVLIDQSSSAESGPASHILVSSSWDNSVKLWSVTINEGEVVKMGKDPLAEFYDAESSVNCVDALNIPDVGLVIAGGGTDGSLIVWLWTNGGEKTVLFKDDANRDGHTSCSTLKWSNGKGGIILFAGFGNGTLSSFAFRHDGMHPVSKLNLGSTVACISIIASKCDLFVGCSDGSLRFVTVRDGGHFDDKDPKSWPAVNGNSSPGISSICALPSSQKNRYTITTGADDGSVALFLIEQIL